MFGLFLSINLKELKQQFYMDFEQFIIIQWRFKLFDLSHLNKGDGLAWASQSNVTAWPSFFIISSNLDLGGNRGGLLPTGSKNEKGEMFTYRGINRYLHIYASI